MKHKILSIGVMFVLSYVMSITSLAQNKLTRNQILNAVRTHQQSGDSVQVMVGDSVICDSTTTKVTMDVLNDSIANNYSYRLTFTKDGIELDVYNKKNYLYRSIFEYTYMSYGELKAKINKGNLRKVDSYDDTTQTKENNILRLYKGNKVYVSIESYNGRTNVTGNFHKLIKEIKNFVPDISSAFSICEEYEMAADTSLLDSPETSLIVSDESVRFKSKGGEFKKLMITSNTDDWEILEYPDWVLILRNNSNEIILESTKNTTRKDRVGTIKIGSLGEIKEIVIIQR